MLTLFAGHGTQTVLPLEVVTRYCPVEQESVQGHKEQECTYSVVISHGIIRTEGEDGVDTDETGGAYKLQCVYGCHHCMCVLIWLLGVGWLFGVL